MPGEYNWQPGSHFPYLPGLRSGIGLFLVTALCAVALLAQYLIQEQRARTPQTDAAAYRDRGEDFTAAGKFAAARHAFTQALRLAPDDPAAYLLRADLATRLGEYQRALPDYDRALALQPTAAVYLHRGQVYAESDAPAPTIADFTAAIRLGVADLAVLVPAYSERSLAILALGLQCIGTQSVEAPAFTPGE
jgi:tetratricopeptide (TPR) repeat protein